jgi:hypothetical protein
VYNYNRLDFSAATNFLLGLMSNIHSAAQLSIVQLATAGSGTLASAIDSREEAGQVQMRWPIRRTWRLW